jgi:zinc protease
MGQFENGEAGMTEHWMRASMGTLVAIVALASAATAQQSGADLEPVASVEGITEYRLENGLRVLLFPDPSKPQITLNITYMVGSRHEGYGETGMAHLLEHLLFKGTPGHPDIMQELAARGAQPNGTTWYDRTNYFEIFPASADNLEWALDLEADRMVNSRVLREDLDSEMTVVRNEMESGENSPTRILLQRVLSTAYLWHNYGNTAIGARSDVENVPIERLQTFYRKYYQPDNAVLLVAGNFDEDAALDLVVEKFAAIPRPVREGANILYSTYTDEPTQDGERVVTLRRVGDLQYVQTLYHIPPGSHPDFAPVEVLAFALGDAPSGRLYRALVETQMATSASASAYQLREASPLMMSAAVNQDRDLTAVLGTLNATVEGVLTEPVTEAEVQRARTAMVSRINQSINSSTGIALDLTEWIGMGDWRLFFLNRDRIEAVTTDDVNRVARAYLKPDNRTVGLFYPTPSPDRAEIPDVPDIEAMVESYRGREAVAEGEAFDPSPANIESRTIRYTLGNGMEIALVPKQTRGDLAMVSTRFMFGDEESLMGRGTAGDLAGSLLMRGTATRSRQQIEDELDRLQASGRVSASGMLGTGQFQTMRGSVPEVLRLLADLLREPTFPEAEFDILKEQMLASIDESRTDPDALAGLELSRAMSQWPAGHVNYPETFEEARASLEATTIEDVQAFHRDFYGPQGGNVVVVGDFDEQEIRQVIEEAFGDWESPHPFRRIATPFYDPPAQEIVIETPDKANAVFLAQQNLSLRDSDPDYPALLMAGYMIGGGSLSSRLTRVIREERGLSYTVQAALSGHPVDPAGQLIVYAISAPENAEAVQSAFVEEMETILRDGFTDEELQTAKQGWLEGRQYARAQDSSLAGQLSQGLYFERTLTFDEQLEDRVRAVTLADVNRVARARLDVSKMTIVKAGDFAQN